MSYRLPKYTGWVKIWIILRWWGSHTEGSFTAAGCSCLKTFRPKGNWQKLNRKCEITRMRVWGCGSLLENGGSLTLRRRREESPGEGAFWVMGRWRVRWDGLWTWLLWWRESWAGGKAFSFTFKNILQDPNLRMSKQLQRARRCFSLLTQKKSELEDDAGIKM